MPSAVLRRPEPVLFLLLALVWGSSYVAVGLVGDELGPLSLVAARLLVGTVALAAVAAVMRIPRPTADRLPHLAVAGALGIVIPFTLITWSQRSVDAGLASILVAATPLVSALIVAGTTRDDHLGTVRVAGLVIGFLGVVAVAEGGIEHGGDPLALLALLGAAVSYAANAAWSRRHLTAIPPMTAAVGQSTAGLVLVLAATVLIERPSLTIPSTQAIGAILFLGLISSGAAAVVYFRLVTAWGATRTMMVNYLTPLVGVGAGAIVLGEQLEPMSLLGGLLVVAGVALTGLGIRGTAVTAAVRDRLPRRGRRIAVAVS